MVVYPRRPICAARAFSLALALVLVATAAVGQQKPAIGAYPAPLGSAPPSIGRSAPPPLTTPQALDPEKADYCRRNPNACSVRPPATGDLLQQQLDDRTEQLNRGLLLEQERQQREQQSK